MALNGRRVVSSRYPYIPIHLTVGTQELEVEALLDTGFDGAVVLPASLLRGITRPDADLRWILADGTEVIAPSYRASVRIGALGPYRVLVSALGDEPIVGLALARRFRITVEFGRQLILEG